jgi:3-hydroxyisobutyrate dehydrogenase-like beta-hydroxyacid dehydrogenase
VSSGPTPGATSASTSGFGPHVEAIRTIGIVSPGAMGSALGRAWSAAGARVVATVTGRSERTVSLATGLELLPDLEAVVSASDLVVSICPPAASDDVLDAVIAAARATGARPLVLDANAVSPDRVTALAARAAGSGLDLVDGALSGGPPTPHGDTMLYLSGPRAEEVAQRPALGLRRRVVGDRPGQASGVKMCTASIYKGTTALWAQALQTAEALGVLRPVLDDLAEEFPEQVAGAGRRIAVATAKSARFVDEMESIARTQGASGASEELFEGMAAVYRRLSGTPLAALSPEEAAALTDLRDVLRRLG